MENKKVALAKLKNKIKKTDKKVWIGLAVIGSFIILAIALIIISMHVNGYSLAQFISSFWGWIVFVIVILLALILTIVFLKVRKGK